jgi:hypothetical protein
MEGLKGHAADHIRRIRALVDALDRALSSHRWELEPAEAELADLERRMEDDIDGLMATRLQIAANDIRRQRSDAQQSGARCLLGRWNTGQNLERKIS